MWLRYQLSTMYATTSAPYYVNFDYEQSLNAYQWMVSGHCPASLENSQHMRSPCIFVSPLMGIWQSPLQCLQFPVGQYSLAC